MSSTAGSRWCSSPSPRAMDAVYADPKEGYLLWAMAAYLVKNPNRTAEQTEGRLPAPRFHAGRLVRRQDHRSARLHDQSASAGLCQGPRRPSSRPRRPRRSPRSPTTSAANSRRAAPGRTAGRPRSSSTNRSGRASRRREPERRCGCGAAMAVEPWARRVLLCLPIDLRRGLPRRAPGADGGDQLLGAGRA